MGTTVAKRHDRNLPHPASLRPIKPPLVPAARESQLMHWEPTNALDPAWMVTMTLRIILLVEPTA